MSTGYHPNTIIMEQPSSSGQIQRVQSGCAIYDENVATTTSTSITNHGFTVINTTKVHTLDAPTSGCIKRILMLPSSGEKARVKTGSTAIFFNSSDDNSHCLNVKSESSKASKFGYPVTLVGASTSQWWVMADQGDKISVSSTAGATVTNLGYTATLTATSS